MRSHAVAEPNVIHQNVHGEKLSTLTCGPSDKSCEGSKQVIMSDCGQAYPEYIVFVTDLGESHGAQSIREKEAP